MGLSYFSRGGIEKGSGARTQDASERGDIPALTGDKIEQLYDICKGIHKISGAEKGHEVIMTYDGGTNKIPRLGINTGRPQTLQIYERCFGEAVHILERFPR
jgi:hypothetical protein